MRFATTMAVLAAALIGLPSAAGATVLGFEDLTVSGDLVPDNYGGLTWTNLLTVTPTLDAPRSGWANGVSGQVMVYNGSEEPGTIGRTSGFTLNSASFVGAWSDGLTITAQGFVGANLTFTKSFVVGTAGAATTVFDWAGVTAVTFSSAGGVDRFFDMSGTQFGLDNLRIDEAVAPVPEPASWMVLLAGFGLTGQALRRRTRRAVRTAIA